MPKPITLRVNDSILNRFKKHAEMENRSISNFIETATLKYIEDIELVDDFEMNEILNNQSLLKSLRKGSLDAKKGRGQFVKI